MAKDVEVTGILFSENLSSQAAVRHGFFTRRFGNGGFARQENSADVHESRERMAASLGIAADHLLLCEQIHSPDVVTVTEIWDDTAYPKADAMVTNQAGLALAILTADCVPVLFADVDAGVIGGAHAGWRGAIGGVLENTLAAMEKLGGRRGRVQVGIGPCIWQDSYEVGPEFPALFLAENPANQRFFRQAAKNGHYQFNLPAYVEAKLRDLGVGGISPSPADTYADSENFYSHRYSTLRGEKRSGNLLSAIALKG